MNDYGKVCIWVWGIRRRLLAASQHTPGVGFWRPHFTGSHMTKKSPCTNGR